MGLETIDGINRLEEKLKTAVLWLVSYLVPWKLWHHAATTPKFPHLPWQWKGYRGSHLFYREERSSGCWPTSSLGMWGRGRWESNPSWAEQSICLCSWKFQNGLQGQHVWEPQLLQVQSELKWGGMSQEVGHGNTHKFNFINWPVQEPCQFSHLPVGDSKKSKILWKNPKLSFMCDFQAV